MTANQPNRTMPTNPASTWQGDQPPDRQPWAARLAATQPTQLLLGQLRVIPGIEVLSEAEAIWLRGNELPDSLSVLLRSSPDAERFMATDKQLMTWGETVPRASLPDGAWQPLAEWLSITLPTAAFAAVVEKQVSLKLVRSERLVESNLLKTTWTAWRDYAITAAQIRLNQSSFAVSDTDEVLVRGLPVPPIPGQRFVEASGIAFPAGWDPDPQLDRDSIRQRLDLPKDHLAMFHEDGQFELIPDAVFVHSTRSAVRATEESMRDSSTDTPAT